MRDARAATETYYFKVNPPRTAEDVIDMLRDGEEFNEDCLFSIDGEKAATLVDHERDIGIEDDSDED